MMFVVDASVAVRWFVAGPAQEEADAVLRRMLAEPELFAVPELFFFEVFAVLTRVHREALPVYLEAFLPAVEGGIFRHPMTAALAQRAGRFLDRGLTGYDACYAGLAEELDARWLTLDGRAHALVGDSSVSVDIHAGLPAGW